MQDAHYKPKAYQPEYNQTVPIVAPTEIIHPIVLGHFKETESWCFLQEQTEGNVRKQILKRELWCQNNREH